MTSAEPELPSPRTDVSSRSPSASPLDARARRLGGWPSSPAATSSSTSAFLPLLQAVSVRTGTSAATLAPRPHLRGKRPPPITSARFPSQSLAVAGLPRVKRPEEAMRSWSSQWDSYPEAVEETGVLRQSKRRATEMELTDDAVVSCSDRHDEGSAQSTENEVVPAGKRKKKRGYRKATHTIRKEEIDHLRVELAQLQAQMSELQRRAFRPDRDEMDEESRSLYTKVLRNAVKKHQEAFVEIQSAMTGYAACNIQVGSPIQRTIILCSDELSRRNALRSMKVQKLRDARDFFNRRLSQLNPLRSMSEDYRFENDEGDYWAVRFATSQFEPARSVKQVFDIVVYYLCNIEISVSEKMGHLTVREDDDSGEEGITQNRLVSLTGKGLHMESNTVVFSDYSAAQPGDEDGYGLIVAEFVDEDERHPYRPAERIRKDVNTVMEVRSFTRRDPTAGNQDEKVVVLTRWSHSRLRHPDFPVRKDGWHELRENMDRWSQNMHKTIMESLDPNVNDSPNWRVEE